MHAHWRRHRHSWLTSTSTSTTPPSTTTKNSFGTIAAATRRRMQKRKNGKQRSFASKPKWSHREHTHTYVWMSSYTIYSRKVQTRANTRTRRRRWRVEYRKKENQIKRISEWVRERGRQTQIVKSRSRITKSIHSILHKRMEWNEMKWMYGNFEWIVMPNWIFRGRSCTVR